MEPRPFNEKGAVFALCFLGFGALFLAIVFMGWIGWQVAVMCWHHPGAIPPVGLAVLGFAVFLRRQRRIEEAEVTRFQWRQPTADETFLEELGIDPSAPQATVALTARRVFAELGAIPPQSVQGGDHFYPDFGKLPFYDSIDALEIWFTLEKELSIKIARPDAEQLLKLVTARPSATVAEAVLEVVRIWTDHNKGAHQ